MLQQQRVKQHMALDSLQILVYLKHYRKFNSHFSKHLENIISPLITNTIYWKDFFANCLRDEFGEHAGQDLDGVTWTFGVSLSNSVNQSVLFEVFDLDFLSFSLLDNSEDECPSTPFECKHDTQAFYCHSLKEKQQGKTQARRKLLITCAVCLIFMIGEVIGENKSACSV